MKLVVSSAQRGSRSSGPVHDMKEQPRLGETRSCDSPSMACIDDAVLYGLAPLIPGVVRSGAISRGCVRGWCRSRGEGLAVWLCEGLCVCVCAAAVPSTNEATFFRVCEGLCVALAILAQVYLL